MLACAEHMSGGYLSRMVAEYVEHARRCIDANNVSAAWLYARAALRAASQGRRGRRVSRGVRENVN